MSKVESPYLDLKESAAYAGFKSEWAWKTIYDWIRKGKIDEKHVGKRGKEIVVLRQGIDDAILGMYKARKFGRKGL